MKTRIIAGLLFAIVLISSTSSTALAAFIAEPVQIENDSIGALGGYLYGYIKNQESLYNNRNFSAPTGQGYAAEQANNLIDRLRGLNSTVVGGNNAKNGADRIINYRDGSQVLIQDKYYNTASNSVKAAFDETTKKYKYIDGNGTLMKLEVPKDQYNEAIEIMKNNIKEGNVPGVTDPEDAESIVMKGKVTYNQAVNIAKAGNIDSLMFDVKQGAVVSTVAFGISFAINYAISRLNGESRETAVQVALLDGFKTGVTVLSVKVLSSQIARTEIAKNVILPLSKKVVSLLNKEALAVIIKSAGINAEGLTGVQIASKATTVLSGNIITSIVLLAVLSAKDTYELLTHRISKEQFLTNLVQAASVLALAGAGAAAGAAIGSAIPGPGTVVGGVVGGLAGGIGGSLATDAVKKRYFKSDADKMYDVINTEFAKLSEEYLVTEAEADTIILDLKEIIKGETLKDMYQSKDRSTFAAEMLTPLFEKTVANRNKVEQPSEDLVRINMEKELSDLVFIH